MSAQATMNIVDDEEMSLQGSVNALVAPQRSMTPEQMMAQAPTEIGGAPSAWTQAMTELLGVVGPSVPLMQMVLVQST